MNACTIIAHNYRAYARVLAAAYSRHHPDTLLSVLVIDGDVTGIDRSAEPFETIVPSQLPLAADEFRRMASMYEVMELATAVKPFFLRFLLDRGADVAMFLDPDIEVFAPLDDLGQLARDHAIVLIPHMRRPIPADGRKPTQADIAASGVYNLGFIAVSREAGPFLAWWGGRLRRDCLVEPDEQLFVDQRVLDFLPGYWHPRIVHDATCDVAYWNLHERRLAWDGTRYEVEGRPLRFFHFSGFDPTAPHLLSRHQQPHPRILLSQEPALAQLCREYAEHLLAAGHRQWVSEPYGFGRTAQDVPFDRRMRRVYRAGLLAAECGESPEPPDPFDRLGADAFIAWLNSPVDAAEGPTRYLRRLYDERLDLRMAFPDLAGPDLGRYAEWVAADGRADPPIPAIFRAAALRRPHSPPGDSAIPLPPPGPSQMGVNIVGYVRAELGIGEGARLTIAAVKAARVPYSVIAYGDTASRQQQPFDDFGDGRPTHDVNLVQVNGDMFPRFAERYGRELLDGRYTVGIWAWEVEAFPAPMAAAERYVDEIWAVSEFAARAIRKAVSKPVFAFPHPMIPPTVARATRADLGLPDAPVFLFCFDFFSVMERKNPGDLVAAFCRAFAPNEGPVLVIKTINGARAVSDLEKLRVLAAGRPDIKIVDGYVPQSRIHALMDACDAYVSLHRGEGFGLTLAECMALGKPVIATGYSGNLDFMNEGNSYLVPAVLTPIPPGCDPYPEGARWAAPDVGEAARLMRDVVDHPEEARRIGRQAREDMLRRHSPEARASFIRSRLSAIRGSRRATREVPPVAPPLPSPDEPRRVDRSAVAQLAASAPPLGSRSALVRLIQRALLRVLRPLLNHQRAVMDKLIETLGDLERAFDQRDQASRIHLERTLDERTQARLAALEHALDERTQARLAALEHALDERAHARLPALEHALDERAQARLPALEHALDERTHARLAALEHALDERAHARLAALEHALDDRRQASLDDVERRGQERLAAASHEVTELVARAVADVQKQVRAELDSVTRTVDGVRQHGETRLEALQRLGSDTAERVQGLLAELHATAYVWDPSLLTGLPDASGRATLGYHSSTGGPTAHPYLRFEEIFRGPETLIKGRQRGYVEMLRGRPAIVDIGCGRGELLDLCREAGIPAHGVDVDPGMVERCRAKGHTVAYADALVYLGQRSDGSLDAIVSTQFIEHLPYEDLIRFLQLSYLKLARDGLFIAETVNPHSIQAFKAFWTDLTHRRPIFPETLLALCRLYGFEEAAVVFPTGTGDVQADRWSQGDYAVVARRGAAGLGTAATACGQ